MDAHVDRLPRLRHCTMLDEGAHRPLRMIVGKDHFDLAEKEGERRSFLRLKSKLDGRHDLSQISSHAGVAEADAAAVIDALSAQGLLRREAAMAFVPAPVFASTLAGTLEMWRSQIGYHRLFQRLATGSVRREVLAGVFIEAYHLVRLAPAHVAPAIAAAETDLARDTLTRYLVDEHDHAHFLLQTCVNLGYREQDVVGSHPIIGTLSLVHMLAEIGRTDSLGYAAALGLFEAAPQDRGEADESVRDIVAAYGLPTATLAPAVKHLHGDLDADHASMLAVLLADVDELPAPRVHRIVNMLHDLKHTYDQLHDSILAYYEDESNYIPRLKVDYFSL